MFNNPGNNFIKNSIKRSIGFEAKIFFCFCYTEGLELLSTCADRMSREAELPFAKTQEGKTITKMLVQELTYYKAQMQECCRIAAMEPKISAKFLPMYADESDLIEQTLCDLEAGRWTEAGTRLNAYKYQRSPTVKGRSSPR